MAKYRIKVEALDPGEELRAEYRMGIECEGFCILMDQGEGKACSAMHDVGVLDIARILADSEETLKAAVLAKAIAEGKRLARDLKASTLAEMIMGGLQGDD